MKFLKMLSLAAVAAMALTAFAASSASAITLEVGGVPQNKAVNISASIAAGDEAVLSRTDGTLANTCTTSAVAGESEAPFTETAKITGAVKTLTFENCTFNPVVVHKAGQLYVEKDPETATSGNVFSENAEVTVPTALGFTVNCKTGTGTKVGTLKGVSAGTQVMEINAVLNCGFLLPSASWKGKYTVTTEGLGVSA